MKTIKALEGFNSYGPDKLAMFAGEIAEVEDDFADQLVDEGKAEEMKSTDYICDRGVLPTGTDLNNVTTVGVYVLANTHTYEHAPVTFGVLEVLKVDMYGGICEHLQRITTANEIYFRLGMLSFSGWYKLTGSAI